MQSWILYSGIFSLAKIPYFNYQLNFQSSHLTKRDRRCLQAPIELLHGSPHIIEKVNQKVKYTIVRVWLCILLYINMYNTIFSGCGMVNKVICYA